MYILQSYLRQVQEGPKIDILQRFRNFHHLLVSINEAIPENVCPISLLITILLMFEVFRIHHTSHFHFQDFPFSEVHYFNHSLKKDLVMLVSNQIPGGVTKKKLKLHVLNHTIF